MTTTTQQMNYLFTPSAPKPTPFLHMKFKDFVRVACGRDYHPMYTTELGMEIEVEGTHLFTSPIQWWKAVADHSLRAYKGHQPVEYVLRNPINRSDLPQALEYLATNLSQSELNFSSRTSIHVHMNALDMKMIDIAKFLCLYFLFEDTIMSAWINPSRTGNLFCLRASDAEFQIENLVAAFQTMDFVESQVFSTEFRYTACNTSSLYTHGTLEFRALQGTMDQSVIKAWVDYLFNLKTMAERFFTTPEDIAEKFSLWGPEDFFRRVCHHTIYDAVVHSSVDLHDTLWTSFRVMRDLCFATDWLSQKSLPNMNVPSGWNPIPAFSDDDEELPSLTISDDDDHNEEDEDENDDF